MAVGSEADHTVRTERPAAPGQRRHDVRRPQIGVGEHPAHDVLV